MIIAVVIVACALTPGAFKVHHVYATYPFPHLIAAWAVVAGSRHLATLNRPGGRRLAGALAAVAVGAVLASNGRTVVSFHRDFERTGGRGSFTSAVYEAADRLWAGPEPHPEVATVDWGIQLPLAAVTDVRRPIRELTWFLRDDTTAVDAVERIRPLVASGRLVVVAHAPEATLFDTSRARFETALGQLGARAEIMAVLRTRTGEPVYELLRITPGVQFPPSPAAPPRSP